MKFQRFISHSIKRCCAAIIIIAVPVSNAQQTDQSLEPEPLSDSQQIKAELDNVKALPFGYTARCENADLKIKSKNSATFVIRNSHLCALYGLGIAIERRQDFTLCSNDPTRIPDAGYSDIKCVELQLQTDSV